MTNLRHHPFFLMTMLIVLSTTLACGLGLPSLNQVSISWPTPTPDPTSAAAQQDSLKVSGQVLTVTWSPDGSMLAAGSSDGTITVWETASLQVVHTFAPQSGEVSAVAWSPNRSLLVSGLSSGELIVWDVETEQPTCTLNVHKERVNSVSFAPDGTAVASAANDQLNSLTDPVRCRHIHSWGGADTIAWSPDGVLLASGRQVRQVATGELVAEGPVSDRSLTDIAFSPDGNLVVFATYDTGHYEWGPLYNGALVVWDAHEGDEVSRSPIGGEGEEFTIKLAWSPNGHFIAFGQEKVVKVLDWKAGQAVVTFFGHTRLITDVAWSPNGDTLASASLDGTVTLWDVSTLSPQPVTVAATPQATVVLQPTPTPTTVPIQATSSNLSSQETGQPALLKNGDFSDALEFWERGHGSNVSDTWDVTIIDKDGQYTQVLDFWRANSRNDGGTVWVKQKVNVDVSQYSSLYLKANVKVIEHTLGGSGWWCDVHNCEGEYPVRLSINYKDANGQKHLWAWGFLTGPNPNELTNYDIVTSGEWYGFTSQNLMALKPRPSVITSISLGGAGWNFHGQIDNVEIISNEESIR